MVQHSNLTSGRAPFSKFTCALKFDLNPNNFVGQFLWVGLHVIAAQKKYFSNKCFSVSGHRNKWLPSTKKMLILVLYPNENQNMTTIYEKLLNTKPFNFFRL